MGATRRLRREAGSGSGRGSGEFGGAYMLPRVFLDEEKDGVSVDSCGAVDGEGG
jgi:hypothetical protein